MKDLFSPHKVPEDFPFQNLIDFTSNCKDVVIFFQNHQVEKSQLETLQEEHKIRHLVAPVDTRWATILGCFSSLLSSEKILHQIVNDREFTEAGGRDQRIKRLKVKEIICEPTFVSDLTHCVKILEPINKLITQFQGDYVPISDVFHSFVQLPKEYELVKPLIQKKFILEKISERWDFIYGDAHGVGYLLDPRYLGEHMDEDLKENVSTFIREFREEDKQEPSSEERRAILTKQLTEFLVYASAQKKNRSTSFLMLLAPPPNRVSILDYWTTVGMRWPVLQGIAQRVFQVVCSSAACERSFSNIGFIHSKLRHRLAPEKVQKLVYIRAHGNLGCPVVEDSDDM